MDIFECPIFLEIVIMLTLYKEVQRYAYVLIHVKLYDGQVQFVTEFL